MTNFIDSKDAGVYKVATNLIFFPIPNLIIFPNGNNVKPNIDPKIIRPSEFHTESDCPNHKSREILQKIGTEIAFLLLKEYKVIKKPIVITSKGVSILE